MNAHRQDMVNVELTVEEVTYAIEYAILKKYPFLDNDDWGIEDISFDEKNLNSCGPDSGKRSGVHYYFTRTVGVDIQPVTKSACDCENYLKPCR